MIVFPNCKINLGLHIVRRRADGFHDLETVFYPLQLTDALEVLSPGTLQFNSSGIAIPGAADDNLCLKAWHLLKKDFPSIAEVDIHLHKHIPIGAGLGGGSADAAFMLMHLNQRFQLGLTTEQLVEYAAALGSDCPFFVLNKACYATGRGEVMTPVELDLKGWTFVLVYPDIHVNTGWAFKQLTPGEPDISLLEVIKRPVEEWKGLMKNDFEIPIFSAHPELAQIKEEMYRQGAVYATMSGSGSSIVGIFPKGGKFETDYKSFII
ncbi:4-(cytidine 5'-diphospho)-2-C-methyl-D-erythritol kinase [[Flexibacter] sp. ATCC 35208]|uniref:4-(cytidine 5'-diphospho)-2-C-methyl-D-erythritol kinase n=1 Tax=[Flexibacter] sp. ATCC 35208 TaxID=1936242 RepID=UPI0009CB369C|nr:4-(cytidine 5'-diphospho)-2-C-methyl-D-erythritol kinase [[Flexibacter] sp. ATCC 35208]OMP77160.1 4-(cytidine 5'-diphospho)-2-C-methyl-D-erythritol kinase [[Flexibacter] sp. ATCC 35208]